MNKTLRELLNDGRGSIKTGPFGTSLSASEYSDSGVPIISVGEVDYGKLTLRRDTPKAPAEVVNRLPEYVLEEGDIVFARKGAVDRSARVGADQAGWFLGSDGLRVRPGSAVDSLWLAYFLSLSTSREWLLRHAAGTTMLSLSGSTLGDLPVDYPTRKTQSAIASVLGALDDKIAANNAVAQTADDLVRAMFDRVTSKQATTVRMDTLVSNVRQMFLPGGSEHQIYIGLEHLPRRLMWCTQTGTSADVSSTKAVFLEDDILFGKLRPYFHKVVSAPAKGVCSTDILVCRPRKVDLAGFALAALTSDAVVARCSAAAEGTRMPRASWADLAACEIGWPGLGGAAALSNTVLALRAAVQAYLRENQTLAELRDTLLPALMSGRIRVKDAERQVEDAV